MTARKVITALALVGVLGMLWMAALTPLRSTEIAELDAEAQRIGEMWAQDMQNSALAEQSNEFFDAARALEPPLSPPVAIGAAMLLAAVAIAAWPGRRGDGESDEASDASAQTSDVTADTGTGERPAHD